MLTLIGLNVIFNKNSTDAVSWYKVPFYGQFD